MNVGKRENEIIKELTFFLMVFYFAHDDERFDPFVGQQRLRKFSEKLLHQSGDVVDSNVSPVVIGATALLLLLQVIPKCPYSRCRPGNSQNAFDLVWIVNGDEHMCNG